MWAVFLFIFLFNKQFFFVKLQWNVWFCWIAYRKYVIEIVMKFQQKHCWLRRARARERGKRPVARLASCCGAYQIAYVSWHDWALRRRRFRYSICSKRCHSKNNALALVSKQSEANELSLLLLLFILFIICNEYNDDRLPNGLTFSDADGVVLRRVCAHYGQYSCARTYVQILLSWNRKKETI